MWRARSKTHIGNWSRTSMMWFFEQRGTWLRASMPEHCSIILRKLLECVALQGYQWDWLRRTQFRKTMRITLKNFFLHWELMDWIGLPATSRLGFVMNFHCSPYWRCGRALVIQDDSDVAHDQKVVAPSERGPSIVSIGKILTDLGLNGGKRSWGIEMGGVQKRVWNQSFKQWQVGLRYKLSCFVCDIDLNAFHTCSRY